jgi:hypothetical protein
VNHSRNTKLWAPAAIAAVLGVFIAWLAMFERSEDRDRMPVRDGSSSATGQSEPPIAGVSALQRDASLVDGAKKPVRDRDPVLVGRLLDEHGNALADVELDSQLAWKAADGRRSQQHGMMHSDSHGGFRIDASTVALHGMSGTLTVMVVGSDPSIDVQATIVLPHELVPGENQLGDLVATREEPLVSGHVVDDRGSDVQRAIITVVDANGEHCNASTDTRGRFKVRGHIPDTVLRVYASREGFGSRTLSGVLPRTRNLRIVLRYGAWIDGSVLTDDALPLERISVHVRRHLVNEPFDPNDDPHEATTVRTDGKFALTSLDPGTVCLDVDCEGAGRLATIESVVLRAGAAVDDPRVRVIDLRGRLVHLRIDVVGEDEKPVGRGAVQCSVGGRPVSYEELRDGKADFIVRETPCDLDVAAAGFRPVHIADVRTNQRVVMTRALRLRLRWHASAELPRSPISVSIALVPADAKAIRAANPASAVRLWPEDEHVFDHDGELTLDAGWPGVYELAWSLAKTTGTLTERRGLTEPKPTRITVADTTDEQVFDVCPEPTRLADALRSLGQ